METRSQVHLPPEAPLDITWVECKVSKLLVKSHTFLQWIIPQWLLVLVLKFEVKVTTLNRYSRKRYCVLAQVQRHYTCQFLPLHKISDQAEKAAHEFARLKLATSNMLYFRHYCLSARMFYSSGQSYLTFLFSTTMLEVEDGGSTKRNITADTVKRHLQDLSRLEHRNQIAICAVEE